MPAMMDRLPYPHHFKGKTFEQWCDEHAVADEEFEALLTFWIAMRLRKSGLLGIMMAGR